MAILNDVTRLIGGLPATGDEITPHSSSNPAGFGKMQDGIEIDLADPAVIQQGDTLHWQGATYAVTQIYQADLAWESVNSGYSMNGFFSYVVQLADPADPANTLTVWLPIDGRIASNEAFLPYPASHQGTTASMVVQGLSPVTSIPWSDVDFDDRIDTICFAGGTMIETASGPVAADALREGDLVLTKDGGLQPVRWVATRHFPARELARLPHLRPIRITAGALGAGLPAADLLVSPQHRILVRSAIAQRMFGAAEVLVAARQLLALDGIAIAEDQAEIAYTHFLFDSHQIVFANGAEAESLYTGPEALRMIGAQSLREVFEIFPELAEASAPPPPPARPLIRGREGRRLAARHQRNDKPLIG